MYIRRENEISILRYVLPNLKTNLIEIIEI